MKFCVEPPPPAVADELSKAPLPATPVPLIVTVWLIPAAPPWPLTSIAPPLLTVTALAGSPKAWALPICNVPAPIVAPPVLEFVPPRVSVPAPALLSALLPASTELIVSL